MTSPEYQRFLGSMAPSQAAWHDGTGYDLEALAALGPVERHLAEDLLVARSRSDWRDIEALDALGSERALAALRGALGSENLEVRIAAAKRLAARGLVTPAELEALLVEILPAVRIGSGLSQALLLAEAHPSEAVRRKLLWCAVHGHDDVRSHAAALAHFLYGRSAAPFDWTMRPLYLRFGSSDARERWQAFLELCQSVGVEPPAEGGL
jgi:hypothetical protein